MIHQTTIHCDYCDGKGKKKSTIKAHTKYRCNQCKLVVSNKSRCCKYHVSAGSYPTFHPEKITSRRCRMCSGTGLIQEQLAESELEPVTEKNIPTRASSEGMMKAVDSLQNSIKFDRKLIQAVKQFRQNESRSSPFAFIKAIVQHIERFQPQKAIRAFREAFLPDNFMDQITGDTECDKWTEKTKLANLLMWTLAFFLQNKTEELAISEIANASASLLGRELSSDGRAVDHNTLGVRLEKPELVQALELMLQLCSAQLGATAFDQERDYFENIYYDWFYLVKGGNCWEICQEVGRVKESNAIKIGIGIEWQSRAVVSLIMHGQHHRNDVVSFKEYLVLKDNPGLVHITDRGPFSTDTMQEIRKRKQHFVIMLKKNIKYRQVHPIFRGSYKFGLDTPSQTTINLHEEALIELCRNPELGEVKYIRFQYNSLRTGKFETIELISSLPLSAEQIIQAHALRWISTETEFRILQHQYGLEKLYIRKPSKAWPLLLLVLCGKMLMEYAFRAIHSLHGSKNIFSYEMMQTASFRRGFANFLNASLTGASNPLNQISPCQDAYCCFRNKRCQRLS